MANAILGSDCALYGQIVLGSDAACIEESGPATYNETMSGGVVAGGLVSVNAIYSLATLGGVVCNGSVDVSKISSAPVSLGALCGGSVVGSITFNPATSSGVVCGGAAVESVTGGAAPQIFDETMQGGIVCGGSARITSRQAYLVSGGALAGGAVVLGARIMQPAVGGAILAGGSADVSAITHASGSTTIDVDCSATSLVGIVASGSTTIDEVDCSATAQTTSNPVVSGGVRCGGSSSITSNRTSQASGGVICNGSANAGKYIYGSGSATIEVSTEATGRIVARLATTGGVLGGGAGSVAYMASGVVSAGVRCGGSAFVSATTLASGSTTISVSTSGAARLVIRSSGSTTISVDCSATARTIAAPAASGGVKLAGQADHSRHTTHNVGVLGGARCGSSAIVGRQASQHSTGGVLCSGSANVGKRVHASGSTSISVSTSASAILRFDPSTSGGAELAGSNLNQIVFSARSSGGAELAGNGYVLATLHASGSTTISVDCSARWYQHVTEALEAQVLRETGRKIYPLRLPQRGATFPAIVYSIMANTHEYTLAGASGIAEARFQFDCFATSYKAKIVLAEELKAALLGQHGRWNTTRIYSVTINNEVDLENPDETKRRLFRRMLDISIRYQESRPKNVLTRQVTTGPVEDSLAGFLSDIASVNPSGRKADLPAIVYKRSGTAFENKLDGTRSNVVSGNFDLSIMASSYKQAHYLADKVRLRMQGLSGQMGDTVLYFCELENESDIYSQEVAGKDRPVFTVEQSWKLLSDE